MYPLWSFNIPWLFNSVNSRTDKGENHWPAASKLSCWILDLSSSWGLPSFSQRYGSSPGVSLLWYMELLLWCLRSQSFAVIKMSRRIIHITLPSSYEYHCDAACVRGLKRFCFSLSDIQNQIMDAWYKTSLALHSFNPDYTTLQWVNNVTELVCVCPPYHSSRLRNSYCQ